ncbi:uncharacterized protein B0H18DRAFT_96538 [Fomitopsis serialis]|uniref:uncharacterized protein n=1 Tax=Fomitopsis serialis TaxID=139415 RepID=UPI002008E321|nr:uncharacterized protein B0H18DRAFT_96538 [Neoantrodia serialis]KAH9915513.1 hypothetical protein B0H18DRAFT_96538 [Neoantrodia serialis]
MCGPAGLCIQSTDTLAIDRSLEAATKKTRCYVSTGTDPSISKPLEPSLAASSRSTAPKNTRSSPVRSRADEQVVGAVSRSSPGSSRSAPDDGARQPVIDCTDAERVRRPSCSLRAPRRRAVRSRSLPGEPSRLWRIGTAGLARGAQGGATAGPHTSQVALNTRILSPTSQPTRSRIANPQPASAPPPPGSPATPSRLAHFGFWTSPSGLLPGNTRAARSPVETARRLNRGRGRTL